MLDLDEQPAAGNDNEMPRAPHGRLPARFWLIYAGLIILIAIVSLWWAGVAFAGIYVWCGGAG